MSPQQRDREFSMQLRGMISRLRAIRHDGVTNTMSDEDLEMAAARCIGAWRAFYEHADLWGGKRFESDAAKADLRAEMLRLLAAAIEAVRPVAEHGRVDPENARVRECFRYLSEAGTRLERIHCAADAP